MKDSTMAQKNNQEWLTSGDVASYFKISLPNASRLLRRHALSLARYIKVTASQRGQNKYYITREGLVVLANVKNTTKQSLTSMINGKQQIVETAIEAVTPSDDPVIRQLQMMMESRKKQLEHEQRIGQVEHRVDLIEKEKFDAQQALFELPAPIVAAPVRTDRSLIRECINKYVRSVNGTGKDYASAWEKLFTECNYRLNTNLTTRSKHTGKDRLDLLEEDGALIHVYAIACEIFKL